ncbi:hypothetical protein V8E36_004167 [Tilletia maclaganii]
MEAWLRIYARMFNIAADQANVTDMMDFAQYTDLTAELSAMMSRADTTESDRLHLNWAEYTAMNSMRTMRDADLGCLLELLQSGDDGREDTGLRRTDMRHAAVRNAALLTAKCFVQAVLAAKAFSLEHQHECLLFEQRAGRRKDNTSSITVASFLGWKPTATTRAAKPKAGSGVKNQETAASGIGQTKNNPGGLAAHLHALRAHLAIVGGDDGALGADLHGDPAYQVLSSAFASGAKADNIPKRDTFDYRGVGRPGRPSPPKSKLRSFERKCISNFKLHKTQGSNKIKLHYNLFRPSAILVDLNDDEPTDEITEEIRGCVREHVDGRLARIADPAGVAMRFTTYSD